MRCARDDKGEGCALVGSGCWSREQQIPPLRCALGGDDDKGEGSALVGSSCWSREQQVPPLRYPEFLSRLMALANFMRLSLRKAAHVDLSDGAKQEFGYAPVGMTNLFGVSKF